MNKELKYFTDSGFLISPELLDKINLIDKENLVENMSGAVVVINEDLVRCIEEDKKKELNWIGFDDARVLFEKKRLADDYNAFLDVLFERTEFNNKEAENFLEREDSEGGVVVLQSYNEKPKKVGVEDFVAIFNNRYRILKEILCNRIELKDAASISRIVNKNKESVALIGIVNDKRLTKNNNLLLELEDLSGKINVLINRNKNELRDAAREIVLDEVIGISGNIDNGFVFANKIFFPDIPVGKELKKSPAEEYAVFISDLHVGSKNFLEEDFNRFLDWVNGVGELENGGNGGIVDKIKYLFLVGDLIEGIGVYPGQENDLKIKDYYQQYRKLDELLKRIPERIKIILCPGNHDAVRLDEPQPPLDKGLLGDLLERENVFSVSNPALVNIGATKDFSGFDVLIYHGGSFTYYADTVDDIRLKGGVTRADLIMKLLLKKRHLAPTHTSTSYLAGSKDNLILNKVPDFFISGHVHRCSVVNHNNVVMLNCGCWASQTDYMEGRGIEPEPSRAIIINLHTMESKITYFGDESKQTNS